MFALRASFVAFLLFPSFLGAQSLPVQPGQRVRVSVPALHLDRAEGVVSAVRADTLALVMPYYRMKLGKPVQDTARRAIPLDEISALEVVVGTKSNFSRGLVRGALVGGGVGLLIGAAAWASSHEPDCQPGQWLCFDWSVGPEAIPVGILGGAMGGGMIGGLIGGMSHQDVWQPVPLPPQKSPVAVYLGRTGFGERRLGLGVALTF